jgi:hypothetical protein
MVTIKDTMRSSKLFATVLFLSTLFSVSCGKTIAPPVSSSAGALTADSSLNSAPLRPFGRHNLSGGGSSYLNDFIRPDVRARLDEEPGGDADGGYDPSTVDPATSSEQISTESGGENQSDDTPKAGTDENDETSLSAPRMDTLKYSWAKKSFGEAIKTAPTNNGVIVLYADENYYDVERLMGLAEEGRNRISESSAVSGDRIQVVFGGYRAIPQVELWVVPRGGPMPEFKAEERPRLTQPEN